MGINVRLAIASSFALSTADSLARRTADRAHVNVHSDLARCRHQSRAVAILAASASLGRDAVHACSTD